MPTADKLREIGDGRFLIDAPGVFDAADCDRLVAYIAELGQVDGAVDLGDGTGTKVDTEVRRSRQTRLARSAETAWAYERVAAVVDRCNAEYFGFHIDGFSEDLVLAEYQRGDFFNWHMDIGPGAANRKLAVSVVLSRPEDYEGGALAFVGSQHKANPPRGSAVVFASFLIHGVQPVTLGTRYALLAWFGGAPFR